MSCIKQKKSNLFFIIVIILVTLITFYNSWGNYFNSDAFMFLNYAKIAEDDPFKIIWSDNISITWFRPASYAYNFFLYNLFYDNPTGHRIGWQIFHLFNSILVFYIVLRLTKNNKIVAFVSSLFFATNSTHSDAVIWVGAGHTLFVTFFFLLTFYSFMRFTEDKSRLFYWLSVIFFVMALLSKVSGVLVFPLIILYEIFIYRRYRFSDVKKIKLSSFGRYIPFFIIALIFIILNSYMQQQNLVIQWGEYRLGMHIIKNMIIYVTMMIMGLPNINFILFSDRLFLESFVHFAFILPVLKIVVYSIFVLVPIVTVLLIVKGNNLVRFCVFWIYIALLDVSLFVYKATSRYSYISSVGFLILLSYLLYSFYFLLKKSNLARYAKAIFVMLVIFIIGAYMVFSIMNSVVFYKEGQKTEEFLNLLQESYPSFPENSRIYVINSPIYPLAVDLAIRFVYDDQSLEVFSIKREDILTVKIDKNTYILEYKKGELITYT